MSERIAAAASQPTPEQLKAAHGAASLLREYLRGEALPAALETLCAALPPLPEVERPTITRASRLARVTQTESSYLRNALDIEAGVHAARREILAWIALQLNEANSGDWHDGFYTACQSLADLIREADRP